MGDEKEPEGGYAAMKMNMSVNNKKIIIEEIALDSVSQSSVVLIGDADVITCSTVFDTPKDSFIMSKQVPIKPLKRSTD